MERITIVNNFYIYCWKVHVSMEMVEWYNPSVGTGDKTSDSMERASKQ